MPDHRILVAGIGNSWLKDQGFGIHVIDRLRGRPLPRSVDLYAWEGGVIAAFQTISERRYDRAVFVAAAARGRAPGTLHRLDDAVTEADDSEVHGRIGDSVMGLVTLENLLIIARHYRAVPDGTVVFEAEPADDTWGNELSPALAPLVEPAADAVLSTVQEWG